MGIDRTNLKPDQISLKTGAITVSEIYDRYSGMLLGYINQIVADKTIAEQYLISIFSELPAHLDSFNTNGISTWCNLQRIAKNKITFNEKLNNNAPSIRSTPIPSNKIFEIMSENQRFVFFNIYYRNKTINALSQELNTSVETVRKTLKEAFNIIKQTA